MRATQGVDPWNRNDAGSSFHLAVSIPPTCAIADVVRYFKGSSTHLINKSRESRIVDTFGWQREYGALSFGERSLNEIVAYIENQKKHHADDKLWSLFEHSNAPIQHPPSAEALYPDKRSSQPRRILSAGGASSG